MKPNVLHTLIAALTLAHGTYAAVPEMIPYQGHILAGNENYNQTGYFKFGLVDPTGTQVHWSNDGTIDGSEPVTPVAIDVDHGFFFVMLGDTSLPGMTESISPGVFTNADVHLRIWFSESEDEAFVVFPDQRIASVGYAMMAAHVAPGAIAAEQLAPDSVGTEQIDNNSVGSEDIADAITLRQLNLGGIDWDGGLRLYAESSGGGGGWVDPSGRLRGTLEGNAAGSELTLLLGSGTPGVVASANTARGTLDLFRDDATRGVGIFGNGQVVLYSPADEKRVHLEAFNGRLRLFSETGDPTLKMVGDDGEFTSVKSVGVAVAVDDNQKKASLAMQDGGGIIRTRGPNNNLTTVLNQNNHGGLITVHDAAGEETIRLVGASTASTGAEVRLKNASGQKTIELDAEWLPGRGGAVRLFKEDGSTGVELFAESGTGGNSRIVTDVLELKGGSDLSERFDIEPASAELEPGMLVSIDPVRPGGLVVSHRAYDRTAAGVISGAGGVKPGMLMGQTGSIADGEHPVALSGRVYCFVDAEYGSVKPGDWITTSDTPGHGMKVTDYSQAQGSVIGKAMTGLESGQGLVLVLVSLQ